MTGQKITLMSKMEWRGPKSCHFMLMIMIFGLVVSRHCDHQHFWDSKSRMCRPCAKCPKNEIIRKPCGRHTDTMCGPFREFNFFNQLDEMDPTYPSYESYLDENSSGRAHVKDQQWSTNERQNEPIVQKDDGEYWKNLAFALIGVVCVLIFVATVVVLMACRKLHETAAVKRPEEDEDDDSGYVVIRAIRPPNMVHRPHASSNINPAPAAAAALLGATQDGTDIDEDASHHSPRRDNVLRVKGTYKPKRRLLNYDADDVFESEDSSGSRTSRKLPLQSIPERLGSSDSDNANVSTRMPV